MLVTVFPAILLTGWCDLFTPSGRSATIGTYVARSVVLWGPLCLFCPTAPIVKPSSRNRGIVRVFQPLRNPLGDGHQVTCDPRGDIDQPDGVLLRDHTVNVNSTTLRLQPTLWL